MYFALNLGTEGINFVSTYTDLSTYNIVGYGLCSDSFVKIYFDRGWYDVAISSW